jgi:predicted ATP-grasp superfamily ATP-dependent carboligase
MLTLSSCGSVTIHDSNVCAIAGVVSAGANCNTIISGIKTQLDEDELIKMLEPNKDRAGAIIIPAKDFVDIKTSLEQACVLLKNRCTEEVKKNIKLISKNLELLINYVDNL